MIGDKHPKKLASFEHKAFKFDFGTSAGTVRLATVADRGRGLCAHHSDGDRGRGEP